MDDTTKLMHQGKTIEQWFKDFNGEFSYEQLVKMAKGGCDLQKILMLGLDETEKTDEACTELPLNTDEGLDEASSDVEAAALSELDESIKPNYIVHVKVLGMNTAFSVNAENEDDAENKVREQIKKLTGDAKVKIEIEKIEAMRSLNESFKNDIVTVEDFVSALKRNLANDKDKIMFRLAKDKSPYDILEMNSNGGTFVVDLIPALANESKNWEDNIDEE